MHVNQLKVKKTANNKRTPMQLIIANRQQKLMTRSSKCNNVVLAWKD